MTLTADPVQWILGIILILSSLGVLVAPKPVHASLSFLLTLLTLAALYLELSAEFIAVMQVLVYAGAILVIFMFVIILFQDAHSQIDAFPPQSAFFLLYTSLGILFLSFIFLGRQFIDFAPASKQLPEGFGNAQTLGQALYIDFFFPFEAVILLFLIAVIGAFYIGKKVSSQKVMATAIKVARPSRP